MDRAIGERIFALAAYCLKGALNLPRLMRCITEAA